MDEVKYITIYYCGVCDRKGFKILHDGKGQYKDRISDCPECGAPDYHQNLYISNIDDQQDGNTPIDHPNAIEMYKQTVRRNIKKTLKDVPVEIFEFGFEQFLAVVLISLIDNEHEFDKYDKLFTDFEDKLADYKDTMKLLGKSYVNAYPDPDNTKLIKTVLEEPGKFEDDLIY